MVIKVEKTVLRNLEQIRAKNAYAARDSIGKGKEGGRAVAKKVPAMIVSNGFIGALAFAVEDNGGYLTVFQAVIKHLHDAKLDCGINANEPQAFLDELCGKSADTLRAITDEAMAYLNYLRRFAKPGKEEADDGDRAQ